MPAPTTPDGVHSHNTTLSYWVTSTTSYVAIGGVTNIKRGDSKITSSKATTLTSSAATEEKLPGLVDEGSISFDVIFKKDRLTLMRSFYRVVKGFQVQTPDGSTTTNGSTMQFSGFVTKLGEEIPLDDLIKMSVEADITGPVTFTEGS